MSKVTRQGPFSGVAFSSPASRAAWAAKLSQLGGKPSTSSGFVNVKLKALVASKT